MVFQYKHFLSAAPVLTLCIVLSGCGDSAADGKPGSNPAPGSKDPAWPAFSANPSTTTNPVNPAEIIAKMPPPIQQGTLQSEIKLDTAKYPQDTPEKAAESLLKALEGNDLGYEIAWLSTPDVTSRLMDKYKSIAAVVAANQEPAKVAGRKAVHDTLQKMVAAKAATHGKVNGIPFFCYFDDGKFMQFERQPDGRWCWNPHVRSIK